MRKITFLGYCLLSLFTFVAAGCSQTADESTASTSDDGQIYLQLTVQNQLQTRAALENSNNEQQVTAVHLYIFDGESDNATCVVSEDVEWKQATGKVAPSQQYKIKSTDKLTEGQDYLLLAVGMDEDSKAAYGLPEAITVGTKLGEANAKLASGKTYKDIATAPVFAGTGMITPGITTGYVNIELKRRVAGILCYLDHIPVNIRKPDGTSTAMVKYLQLVLGQRQNTSISLKKKDGDDYGAEQSTEEDSKVLAEWLLGPGDSWGDDGVINISTNGNYYEFIISPEEGGSTGAMGVEKSTTVFQGFYALPMRQLTSTVTLAIRVLDNDRNVLNTWELNNGISTDYSLKANYIYSIGVKNDKEDAPLDLLSDEVILVPDYEVVYEVSDTEKNE